VFVVLLDRSGITSYIDFNSDDVASRLHMLFSL